LLQTSFVFKYWWKMRGTFWTHRQKFLAMSLRADRLNLYYY